MTTVPATSSSSPSPDGPANDDGADAKAPLQWGLVAVAVPVMALAFGGAALIGESQNALGAGLIAMLTTISALVTPRERLVRAATVIGGATFAMLILADVTIEVPVLAGLAMFAVAFLGAMIGGASQALSVAGIFISMAYLLPAATGIAKDLSFAKGIELGLVGLATAFIAIAVVTGIRAVKGRSEAEAADERPEAADAPHGPLAQATSPEPEAPDSAQPPAPSAAEQFRAALTLRNATFRYALRRAVALGIAMAVYAATANHNVFWVMLTIFIVLQPDRASSWDKALSRSIGVMIGAIIVAGLGQFLPSEVIIGLAVVVLLIGFAWYQRSYTVFAAGLSFTVVAIFGASDGSFANWAALRIADTLVGAVIALLVGYLVFPDPWWRKGQEATVTPGSA